MIATKAYGCMDKTDVNARGLSRKSIISAVDGSLHRLNTHYIDLFQCHMWDDATPLEETFRTLNDLIRIGKIHYVGLSNVLGWQFQKIIDTCRCVHLSL